MARNVRALPIAGLIAVFGACGPSSNLTGQAGASPTGGRGGTAGTLASGTAGTHAAAGSGGVAGRGGEGGTANAGGMGGFAGTAGGPPIFYPVTVLPAGNGAGIVTSDPRGIDCGTTCSAMFERSVILRAEPDGNSSFERWSDNCGGGFGGQGGGQGPYCYLSFNGPSTVTATFSLKKEVLKVVVADNGTVTSTPAGINCGPTCSATFDRGSTVTLTATPAPGWTFNGWSPSNFGSGGPQCIATGPCMVPAQPPLNNTFPGPMVGATFVDTATLSLSRAGASTPPGKAPRRRRAR